MLAPAALVLVLVVAVVPKAVMAVMAAKHGPQEGATHSAGESASHASHRVVMLRGIGPRGRIPITCNRSRVAHN
jgi:hypothetical protein